MSLGMDFGNFKCSSQAQCLSLFLLYVAPDVEHLAPSLVPCLPVCAMLPTMLNKLLNCEQAAKLNVFLYKNCHGHGVSL